MLRPVARLAAVLMAIAVVMGTRDVGIQAAGALAGSLQGTVNFAPGFVTPPAPLAAQNWTFSSTVVTGVGASTQCTGVLAAVATASGASIAENVAGGVGTFSLNASGGCTLGSISVGCTGGVYLREGVIVELATICTAGGQAALTALAVPVAVLLPNQTPPATIASGALVGAWSIVSV